ncbi:MAG TPA: hypothetical protein PK257_00740 [Candidatus Woesebacteria bacterium]|nr:hypothetical protein [Candidatus Woesebacteria bacterium]
MLPVLFLIFVFSLILITPTNADFVYKTTIKNNQLSVSTFDFSQLKTTNNSSVDNLFNINGISPGGYQVNTLRLKNQGSTNFNYIINFEKINGDDNFCRQLEINFNKSGQSQYQGPITDLNVTSSIDKDQNFSDWLLYLKLKDNYLSSKPEFCEFNLVVNGSNVDLNQKSGFKYKRTIRNLVVSN